MINIPCLEYSENIHIITFTVSQPHKPNRIFILFYVSLKNYLRLGCKIYTQLPRMKPILYCYITKVCD